MPSVAIHTASSSAWSSTTTENPLPSLLQTPSGLAILEIQGTIHAPFPNSDEVDESTDGTTIVSTTSIGRLEFPLYEPTAKDEKWMKKVYLYVGKHQRLTGEIKKLPKPLVVIGKRRQRPHTEGDSEMISKEDGQPDDYLEILEIVKHKILFGGRPEPVGE